MTPYNDCRIGAFCEDIRQSLEHLFLIAFSYFLLGRSIQGMYVIHPLQGCRLGSDWLRSSCAEKALGSLQAAS